MTEEGARNHIAERFDASKLVMLDRYREILIAANDGQNLIAPSTVPTIWSRHLLDSAQLLDHAPSDWDHWIDIGSGAGLPGIVVAILSARHMTLIEPRRLRAEFLARCCDALGLARVRILQTRAETADAAHPADVVSARAVAKLGALFSASRRFSDRSTIFILPKGESAKSEVAEAQRSWQGEFHVEHSIVDPKSGIVVATGIAPR